MNSRMGLSNKTILGYSLGSFSFMLLVYTANTYYSYYLTDIVEIGSLELIGAFLFVVRLVDAVMTIISGYVIQNLHLRWGKYSSWLILMPPVIALSIIITYWDFHAYVWVKIGIYFVFYVICHTAMSFVANGHMGLMSEIGKNQIEISILASRYNQSAVLGQIVVSLLALPMVGLLGRGSESAGFLKVIALFSFIMIIGYYITYLTVKKYDTYSESLNEKRQEKISFLKNLRLVNANKEYRRLCLSNLFRFVGENLVIIASIYYFKYVVVRVDQFSIMLALVSIMAFLGNFFTKFLIKCFDSKKTYIMGVILFSVNLIVAFIFHNSSTVYIVAISCGFLGLAIARTASLIMVSDCVSHGIKIAKKNLKGFMMGIFIFTTKIALAISSLLCNVGLSVAGYVPNQAIDSHTSSGILLICTLVPLLFSVLSSISISGYKLSTRQLADNN